LPVALAVRDFNLDLRPDLAIANAGESDVTILLNSINSPLTVSSASGMPTVAPGSQISIYGSGLASSAATAPTGPLPLILGGTTVTMTDSKSAQFSLPLFYAGPAQINALIPQAANPGPATFAIYTSSGTQKSSATIAQIAPGLFTANETGKGVALGQFIETMTVFPSVMNVYQCGGGPGTCVTVPLDVSMGAGTLVLYGTGIHNVAPASAVMATITSQTAAVLMPPTAVAYEASANGLGLDQVNITLPSSLAHSGLVNIQVAIGGVLSNIVTAYLL
jgi:uncharacterized protein (TIGR03437 family)